MHKEDFVFYNYSRLVFFKFHHATSFLLLLVFIIPPIISGIAQLCHLTMLYSLFKKGFYLNYSLVSAPIFISPAFSGTHTCISPGPLLAQE